MDEGGAILSAKFALEEPEMLMKLWMDEGGAILSTELILIMVLTVIGMIVGLTASRDAVGYQLADLAGAIAAIDISYSWDGLKYNATGFGLAGGPTAVVADSEYKASFNRSGESGVGLLSVLTQDSPKDWPDENAKLLQLFLLRLGILYT